MGVLYVHLFGSGSANGHLTVTAERGRLYVSLSEQDSLGCSKSMVQPQCCLNTTKATALQQNSFATALQKVCDRFATALRQLCGNVATVSSIYPYELKASSQMQAVKGGNVATASSIYPYELKANSQIQVVKGKRSRPSAYFIFRPRLGLIFLSASLRSATPPPVAFAFSPYAPLLDGDEKGGINTMVKYRTSTRIDFHRPLPHKHGIHLFFSGHRQKRA